MNRSAVLCFALLTGVSAEAQTAARLIGAWEGLLTVESRPAVVRLMISTSSGGFRGELSLDGGDKISAKHVGVSGSKLALDLGPNGTYEGVFDAAKDRILGNWRPDPKGGGALPLSFTRAAAEKVTNFYQQTPPPYPYIVEDVVIRGVKPEMRIAATINRPKTNEKRPAVVLHHGVGPFARDSYLSAFAPLWVIGDVLARRGFIVVRYDKRGVGGTSGSYPASTIADFAEDARIVAAWLRGRPDVDATKVGYLGVSEGGLVSLVAASKDPLAAFVVALASPAQQGRKQAEEMLDAYVRESGAPAFLRYLGRPAIAQVVEVLSNEPDDAKAASKLSFLPKEVRSVVAAPWTRFYITHDVKATLGAVRCPVYGVYFDRDVLVPAAGNMAALREGLAAGGNKDVTIEFRDDVDHLLHSTKPEPVDIGGRRTATVAPVLLDRFVPWIASKTGLAVEAAVAADSRPR